MQQNISVPTKLPAPQAAPVHAPITPSGAVPTVSQGRQGGVPFPAIHPLAPNFYESREGKELIARLEEYQVRELRRRLDADLSDIKAAYPDVSAKDVRELGETYLSIMKAGGVDAISAYEAQLAAARRKKKDAPPAIGAVNTTGVREKDFYSPDEVDRLTDKDFEKNPKLLSLVLRSMTRWK